MKIEIEGSEQAVMDIIRAIAGIPQVAIDKIASIAQQKTIDPALPIPETILTTTEVTSALIAEAIPEEPEPPVKKAPKVEGGG